MYRPIMSKARKHKHQQLSDIANIRVGYTFREKVQEVDDGNARIIQIKDARKALEQSGSIRLLPDFLPMINWSGSKKISVDNACVILPVRGDYSRAFYIGINSVDNIPVIVSSQFLILTPKNQSIRSEYLCWALNQSSAQNYLKQESQGTKMSMLSLASVSALKLIVPSIDIQDRIIKLNQLWEKEKELTRKLLDNREKFIDAMFQQLINGK